MKLMASGVIFSAAMARSPSFSRSSSSTRTIMRPWRISSTASSTVAKAERASVIAEYPSFGFDDSTGDLGDGRVTGVFRDPGKSGAEQRIGINTEAAEMMGAMDRHQN